MTKQQGFSTSLYITLKTKKRLEFLCNKVSENRSRVVAELVDREYQRMKKEDKK